MVWSFGAGKLPILLEKQRTHGFSSSFENGERLLDFSLGYTYTQYLWMDKVSGHGRKNHVCWILLRHVVPFLKHLRLIWKMKVWTMLPRLHHRSSTLPLKTVAIPKEESRLPSNQVSSPGHRSQWLSELSSCNKVIHYLLCYTLSFNLHVEEPPKKWKFHRTALTKKNRWLTYPGSPKGCFFLRKNMLVTIHFIIILLGLVF